MCAFLQLAARRIGVAGKGAPQERQDLYKALGRQFVDSAREDDGAADLGGLAEFLEIDAVVLDEWVALQRLQGEGECGVQIELTDSASTSIWTPDDATCNVTLLGVRNGAWLVHVGPLHGTFGSQYQGPGVLYEISPLGDRRPLTPTTLPSSWNSPGVLSNVQIIGS